MDTLIESLVNGNVMNTEEIADQFVKALTDDRHKLERGEGEGISDCAFHAPNLGTQVEKQFGIAHTIARKCFADVVDGEDSSNEKTRKWQYILYKRLIRDLRNTLREHRRTLAAATEKPKKKTVPPHQDAPLSEVVLEPAAMPVEIPPVEEFEPFFEFLEQNQELGPDDGEPYPYTPHTRFLQFKRGAVYTDQRMDLCKQVVGPTHISQLMNSLRKNQQIMHFLLGNNIIGKVGAQAIADFINNGGDDTLERNKIKTWYLAGNDIDEEGMALIARALQTDSVCQSLWLKRNPIKLGVKDLAQTLTVNHTMKVLDLSNTGILDAGAEVLFAALSTNYGLRFLYLDANGLSGKTAGYVVEYIAKLDGRKGVTNMWLSMNRFYDDFIPAFKALGGYEHLKRLNVGSGRLGPASAQAIYEAFAHHSRLKVLDVGMYKATYDMGELPNSMGDEGAKWLAMLIAETESLREIDIHGNGMTNAGFELLAQALAENKSGILFFDHLERVPVVTQKLRDEISKTIERNLRVQYAETDLSKLDLTALKKRLRHGKQIFEIDSVYRNRTKY